MNILLKSAAVFALAGLASAAALAATLEVSGSTTVQERAFKNADAKLKAVTGMDIKFLPVGTGRGLIALVEGKVPVSASSETLVNTIEGAKKAAKDMDKPFNAPANLVFHELSRDSIKPARRKFAPPKKKSMKWARIKALSAHSAKRSSAPTRAR